MQAVHGMTMFLGRRLRVPWASFSVRRMSGKFQVGWGYRVSLCSASVNDAANTDHPGLRFLRTALTCAPGVSRPSLTADIRLSLVLRSIGPIAGAITVPLSVSYRRWFPALPSEA